MARNELVFRFCSRHFLQKASNMTTFLSEDMPPPLNGALIGSDLTTHTQPNDNLFEGGRVVSIGLN